MSILKKIIFLLFPILFFSCQTRLEKRGWQRAAIVTHMKTPTFNKDKELVVQKMHDKKTYYYWLHISEKDSTGKIVNNRKWGYGSFFCNSDIAYYKWESDSVCLVKLLNQGNVQASLKLGFGLSHQPGEGYWNSLDVLDELKK